jgi:hypothetical protein
MVKLRLQIETPAWSAAPAPRTALLMLSMCAPEWAARSQSSTRCWGGKNHPVAARSILRKSQKGLKKVLKVQTKNSAVRFGNLPLLPTAKILVQT